MVLKMRVHDDDADDDALSARTPARHCSRRTIVSSNYTLRVIIIRRCAQVQCKQNNKRV